MRRTIPVLPAILVAGAAQAQNSLSGQSLASVSPTLIKPTSHLWQSLIPWWGQSVQTIAASAGTFTFGQDFSVEAPFTAVQIIFQNRGVSAITIPNAVVAASASAADQVTPRDANGNALSWLPVTCGGAASCTLAPAASATRSQLTLSDPIPISSLPRSDGGQYPLLFTRVLSPNSGSYAAPTVPPAAVAAYDGLPNTRPVYQYFSTGDYVSTAGNQASLSTPQVQGQSYQLIAGIRYLSPQRVVTILGCGDSLTAGYLTTSGYNGFGLQAANALSKTLGIGISYVAHGFPGTLEADFTADCQQALSLLQPAVVTIPSDSPNNWNAQTLGNTAGNVAQVASQSQQSLSTADAALSAGSLPIVLTPIPFGNVMDTSAQYGGYRQQIGAQVRAMNAAGVLTLDAQTILSGYVPSPSILQQVQAGYLASDNLHLDDAGQAILGSRLAALVGPYLK